MPKARERDSSGEVNLSSSRPTLYRVGPRRGDSVIAAPIMRMSEVPPLREGGRGRLPFLCMPSMGVHARQGFNIQPHPATGHLGRVDNSIHISTLLKSNVNVNDDVN